MTTIRRSCVAALAVCATFTVHADLLDSVDFTARLCDWVVSRNVSNYSIEYYDGLTMDGLYRVWQRTGTQAYFNFFRNWMDQWATDGGLRNWDYGSSLDMMHNGFALCYLYDETGEQKYRTCAGQIRQALNQYPRHQPEGTPIHGRGNLPDCIWLDGVWMLGHFLGNYGRTIGEKAFCDSVCVSHMLHVHGFLKDADTVNQPPWHAACPPEVRGMKWCRAIGWAVAQMAELIDLLPGDHPQRQAIIDIETGYLRALMKYQDTLSGMWYEVVNMPDADGNWVELSSTCMYSYAMRNGIDEGWLDSAEFLKSAKLAYQGIMGAALLNQQGHPVLYGCVAGTIVGDYNYYINQPQPVNDAHGTGAWLISAEYQRGRYGDNVRRIYQAEEASFSGAREASVRGFTGSGYVNTSNETGAHIQWTVHSAVEADAHLTFRYANDGAQKPASVKVNGNQIETLDFPSTGNLNRYRGQSVTASLSEGDNIVRLEAATGAGCANIDLLAVDRDETTGAGVPITGTVRPARQPSRYLKVCGDSRVQLPGVIYDLTGRKAADSDGNVFTKGSLSRGTYIISISDR